MKSLLPLIALMICAFPAPAQDVKPTPQWRPVYHFTPLQHWTNDPNGLVYLDGTYHMYNQQNPFANKWGHMSWGHATSTDLVHWKHLPIAIPEKIDKDTTWIFSGSAVWDKNNSSGFCTNGGCLVAIYTADQPNRKKESQFIAYSNDGGMSFTNYENNPVIDLQKKDFRDPNVSWNRDLNQWLMVVASPTENKVLFYGSGNLKNWELLGDFGAAGLKHGIWECPSLMELPIEGAQGKKKWVLMNSFGGLGKPMEQYFVGTFDGRKFTNDNPPDTSLLVDEGNTFYAAIPWNDAPLNKTLFIGWLVPEPQQTYPWRGQMSIPRELSLKQTGNGLRLVQQPAALIKNNLSAMPGVRSFEIKNKQIRKGEIPLFQAEHINGNAYWIDAELELSDGAAGFKLTQKKDARNKIVSEVVVGYDADHHEVYVDRSKSGKVNLRKEYLRQSFYLPDATNMVKMEILLDRSSLEIFINNGEKVLSTMVFPEENANHLSAFSTGKGALIRTMKIWDMSRIK